MSENVKKTVFVMSTKNGNTNTCPRLLVAKENTVLRDDYKGNISLAKKLLSKISLL